MYFENAFAPVDLQHMFTTFCSFSKTSLGLWSGGSPFSNHDKSKSDRGRSATGDAHEVFWLQLNHVSTLVSFCVLQRREA